MLVFDSCCCCIPLRTGSLVIGYLNLIANIILTITTILSLSAGIAITYAGYDDGGAGTVIIAVSAVLLIFVLIFLAFTIALLVGLHKEKPGHVKAFLIYGLVFLIIYTIFFILNVSTAAPDVFNIIGTLIEIILNAYFLLVIRSHYVNMRDSNLNSA